MTRKTRAQLEAELEAANKRCADLADALVKQVMAQPVYYPVPYYPVPAAVPMYPTWYGGGTFQWTAQNAGVCGGGGGGLMLEMKS